MNLVVSSNTVIKDLTTDLQNKIKTKIKETTDLEVKEVNVTIKRAIPQKSEKSPPEKLCENPQCYGDLDGSEIEALLKGEVE